MKVANASNKFLRGLLLAGTASAFWASPALAQ